MSCACAPGVQALRHVCFVYHSLMQADRMADEHNNYGLLFIGIRISITCFIGTEAYIVFLCYSSTLVRRLCHRCRWIRLPIGGFSLCLSVLPSTLRPQQSREPPLGRHKAWPNEGVSSSRRGHGWSWRWGGRHSRARVG